MHHVLFSQTCSGVMQVESSDTSLTSNAEMADDKYGLQRMQYDGLVEINIFFSIYF